MEKIKEFYQLVSKLHKFGITYTVTLTTLAGFTLAARTLDSRIIIPLIGIFILSSGSAVMNEYQERRWDAIMRRTRKRPIPSGKIKPNTALAISVSEIIVGTLLVYFGGGMTAAILAFMAFIWYNAIYTPLKRVSSYAVIPGSVIGSLPPMVGWVVGGGSLLVPGVYVMAAFFFVAQVPHFWLLMIKYGDDYISAGYPTINEKMNLVQIKRLTFIWIVATAVNIVILIFFGLIQTPVFKIVIVASAIWLVVAFARLLRKTDDDFNPIRYFIKMNFVFLAVILSMVIDPLF
ncbi:MAG: protoheme IX farnesyltransferase [Porphyromonadaceae bacterium]|nr:protoheme IX farnesyltransferase [Porphyromonadaceae bacterium]